MTHAFLIIAHNEFEVLKLLISKLDDFGNDIYVHIDKKVKELPSLKTDKSQLFVLDKRIDVKWGHVSQIETELVLFEEALKHGPYEYYHIISGTHLLVTPIESFYSFFERCKGFEVMHFWDDNDWEVDVKIRRRNLMIAHYKSENAILRYVSQHLFTISQFVQRNLNIKRYRQESFKKTDNWVSLTESAVKYLVARKGEILRKYRYSFCADEFFVASELANAEDGFSFYNTGQMLYVVFDGSNPRVLSIKDRPAIEQSGCFFARKFSDVEIVEWK